MGLPSNNSNLDQSNSILFNIWYRGHNPSRSRIPKLTCVTLQFGTQRWRNQIPSGFATRNKRWNTSHIGRIPSRAARYFNTAVNLRKFLLGNWVLRKVSPIIRDPNDRKLGPQWEGPYKVIKCHDKGAYHLIDTEGKTLPRAWNVKHLKKYFVWSTCNRILFQQSELLENAYRF